MSSFTPNKDVEVVFQNSNSLSKVSQLLKSCLRQDGCLSIVFAVIVVAPQISLWQGARA